MNHNKFLITICTLAAFFSVSFIAKALNPKDVSNVIPDGIISSYKELGDVSIPKIVVPTVVEASLNNVNLERFDFAVYDKTTSTFEPHLFLTKTNTTPVSVSVYSQLNKTISVSDSLSDSNESTYVDIPLISEGYNTAEIRLDSKDEITSDSLTLLLDNYVTLPKTISISTWSGSQQKIVLAETNMFSQTVHFPAATSNRWTVNLKFGQPLRITEVYLANKNNNLRNSNSLRFLAQPANEYQIYFNPDRIVNINVGESANLYDNNGVIDSNIVSVKNNPSYIIADTDGDGIPDIRDNCVYIANKDQADLNDNGKGDVCDDFDKDGIINSKDNCQNIPNYNQQDTDGDKIGDACDGVESRITEKYKWLPWIGIGAAGIVVAGLFVFTFLSMIKKKED